ncbi:hypothetical protein QBC40DRAFT_260726 [Triangularia verruculosa]|uniref:Uncharacterized protein n=1 Tax=Triangularia verruculosa TaxID=2587418 RepID=A0AAN7B0L3_9PEZI|nr:hypothetical protein QBC40DRAFT_260726 [Triangularia verruculosa]
MTEVARRPEDAAIARRKAAGDLQKDIKLSLAQNHSLPDMLMTAPLAINLLGQIKLLAFSDDALHIRLTEPQGGFKHIQRTSLCSAMIQIVDQSADAFDMAEKKLRAIRMQTNVMFGKAGHVQTILMCLQDQRMAKKDLLGSMSRFERDMEKCAKWAEEMESQFNDLVECAAEVNMAMSEEMTIAAEEKRVIKDQVLRAESDKQQQTNVLEVLKSRVNDAQCEFVEARKQYQKTSSSSKGETSALFMAAAIGLGSSLTGLINATVGVLKDTPKVAVETAKAVGRVGAGISLQHHGGAASSEPVSAGVCPTAPRRHETAVLDSALLCAEQIEAELLDLNHHLNSNLLQLVEHGGSEILRCSARFEDLKKNLGSHEGKHVTTARAILNDALDITAHILSGNTKRSGDQWHRQTVRWNESLKALLNRTTKLRAIAMSQPGQGFGSSMDNGPIRVLPSAGASAYDRVLHQRHQTLLIKRSAMNEARVNLEKQTESQLQAQAEIIDIARKMKELANKQTTIEDTKLVLRKALDVIVAMQNHVRQLTGFFNGLAQIISIVCKGQAETYLATIEAGISSSSQDKFLLAHSEHQLRVIRETVITLRGHFGFVVHSADMYQEIATQYINPCIRMAATLPLSAGEVEQNQATQQLKSMTDESSEAIKRLAQREMETYQRDLESRVLEIEGEMAALGWEPSNEEEQQGNLQAIEDGIKESAEDMVEEREEYMELFEEITDDM